MMIGLRFEEPCNNKSTILGPSTLYNRTRPYLQLKINIKDCGGTYMGKLGNGAKMFALSILKSHLFRGWMKV